MAQPATLDLDEVALQTLLDSVDAGRYGEIGALLVSRNGHLAVEAYFGAHERTTRHLVQSVTKSVTSLLVGIAVGQGHLALDDPLVSVLTSRSAEIADHPRKAGITVRDLLTMRAGIEWDEWSCPFSDLSCNTNAQMNRSPDWVGYVLGLPQAEEPGARFVYNTGASILLGAALRDATGMDPAEYADRFLLGPLGIESRSWIRNQAHPDRLPHTGGGLAVTARAQAKLGQLILGGGHWNGERIVSEGWLEASRVAAEPVSFQRSYGLHWWYRRSADPAAALGGQVDWLAWGFGGQHVFVVEGLDLVVAIQADNADGSTHGLELIDELAKTVIR